MNSSLRSWRTWICIAACWYLIISGEDLYAQDIDKQYEPDTLLTAARAIIEAAEYCALVTVDDEGRPRVRTMDPFNPDSDMIFWLGTHRKSRKVKHIQANPRVALYYEADGGMGYVAISGLARLVDDPLEKERRWKDEWQQFYVDRESDYLLIKVIPEALEVVDYSRDIVGDPDTWKVPSIRFKSEPVEN